jgi:translation initiation factor 2 beta subunit (eIF-2beta)/eIF-5
MFVRKKKNPSGIISVQVIDKHSGVYKVIKTIGSSNDIEEVNKLVLEGKLWIDEYEGKQDLFKSYFSKDWL